MYSVVLATVLMAGGEATAWGRHHGCHGCHGSSGYAFSNGCYGGGCWGGGCHGCWGGGVHVSVGAFHGCHGCWGSSCYGNSCFGCYGSSCYGCWGSTGYGLGGAGFAFYSGCHGFGGTSCYGNYAGGFGCFGGNDVIVAVPAFAAQPQAAVQSVGNGSSSYAEQGPRPSSEGKGGRDIDALRREVRETNSRLDSLQSTVNRLAEQLSSVPPGGPGAPARRQ